MKLRLVTEEESNDEEDLMCPMVFEEIKMEIITSLVKWRLTSYDELLEAFVRTTWWYEKAL